MLAVAELSVELSGLENAGVSKTAVSAMCLSRRRVVPRPTNARMVGVPRAPTQKKKPRPAHLSATSRLSAPVSVVVSRVPMDPSSAKALPPLKRDRQSCVTSCRIFRVHTFEVRVQRLPREPDRGRGGDKRTAGTRAEFNHRRMGGECSTFEVIAECLAHSLDSPRSTPGTRRPPRTRHRKTHSGR